MLAKAKPTWLVSRFTVAAAFLLAMGTLVRVGWLEWQPLWADEGYSIYFATEPVARLLWLTAQDIHPPLYYLLLHGWITWWTATPLALRLLSVCFALPGLGLGIILARAFFGGRWRPQLLFLLFLAINPLVLYYSQEVRMYGLALTLSMATTLCCWQWLQREQQGYRATGWLLGYLLSATLALYTLYYLAFLLVAQLLWVHWELRKQPAPLLRFWLAETTIGLLYLPWVLYTIRLLLAYIDDKIRADQDTPLGLMTYAARHFLAFTSGHLAWPAAWAPWWALLAPLTIGATLILLLWAAWGQQWRTTTSQTQQALRLVWFCLAMPFAIGYGINLLYPFFPIGGERLLLFVLPYFGLLLVASLDDLWQGTGLQKLMASVALLPLLASAIIGVGLFYTLPRYPAEDYRPLVRQLVQQGSDADTVLATYPWQVGLWRAYAPTVGLPPTAGPTVTLLSDRAVAWGPAVADQIDAALAQGMLWVPSLRSIGSTLPAAIDTYLADHAVNFAQQWYGTTTLDAWRRIDPVDVVPVKITWPDVTLVAVGVNTAKLPAANTPLLIALDWANTAPLPQVGVTIRLQQAEHTWAARDYATMAEMPTVHRAGQVRTLVGLMVPAGLPPGSYQLVIGLIDAAGKVHSPLGITDVKAALLPIGTVTVTNPTLPIPPFRLPIQVPRPTPVVAEGVALLGYSRGEARHLAGTALALTLFWQSQTTTLADRQLYISLLDQHGAGIAGWEGWPLPAYPPSAWPLGALVQLPVEFLVPGTVPSGDYTLIVGWLDSTTGTKSPAIELGPLAVVQRQATFTPPQPPQPLPEPAQFGTHAQLLGYDWHVQGEQSLLTLYWQVLQPLWPPHQIFVHVDDDMAASPGLTLAQADDTPQTAMGPAPTGSWQSGEYLATQHFLPTSALQSPGVVVRVGLYLPTTNVRLPLSIAGMPAGDAFLLPPP
ncbi:MAG: hypothetical protein KF832_00070 [Caldilineaceae bacterium]|nr:hypothetical protein [Caldilineaceae bacterium]